MEYSIKFLIFNQETRLTYDGIDGGWVLQLPIALHPNRYCPDRASQADRMDAPWPESGLAIGTGLISSGFA